MVSFFKASCSIYWLTGLFCMAYFMATSLYTDRFVYSDINSARNIQSYIQFLSIFNLCYSFVGCVFVKCNITHIVYALLFVLPMLGVNFTVGILGLIASKGSLDDFPSPSEMITISQKYRKDHNDKYPIWLHHTQENANCCGIVSYLDYPGFIYPNATNLKDALPQSCCYDTRTDKCTNAFDVGKHLNATNTTVKNEYQVRSNNCHNAHIHNLDQNDVMKIISKIENKNNFSLLKNMTPILPTCGCYHDIKESFEQLFGSAHFVYFIVIMILTAVMLFVYIKNWCNNRGVDSGSEHSLDTDNMSLLNITLPVLNTTAAAKVGDSKKESTTTVPGKSVGLTKVNIGDTEK